MTVSAISPYEARRWRELNEHWSKKAKHRELVPPKARAALGAVGERTKVLAVRAGTAVAEATPESLKEFGSKAVDAALVPAVEGILRTIDLVNDWVVELTDPQKVIDFHRRKGRDLASLADLRELDLADLDEVVRRLVLYVERRRVGGGSRSDHPVSLPFDPISPDRFRRDHAGDTFWCGTLPGGCGKQGATKRYTESVCHFVLADLASHDARLRPGPREGIALASPVAQWLDRDRRIVRGEVPAPAQGLEARRPAGRAVPRPVSAVRPCAANSSSAVAVTS